MKLPKFEIYYESRLKDTNDEWLDDIEVVQAINEDAAIDKFNSMPAGDYEFRNVKCNGEFIQ